MDKISLNPSTLLAPVPVVMVSCGTMESSNIITLAWVGTVNSEPPMVSISVRKSRFSHPILTESGRFVINLVSESIAADCDFCGVKSGRDVDKFEERHFTKVKGPATGVPMIGESPVNIECEVREVIELGSHDMFIAEVKAVHVAKDLCDEKGAVDFGKAGLVAYCHGDYYRLGKMLGFFGYSVARKEVLKRRMKK